VPFYIGLTWRSVAGLVIAALVVGLVIGFFAGRALG
jgi:flagellar biosynthesis protein FliQ